MPKDVLIPGSPEGWPPPVKLRVSPRARHMSIRISRRDGLVVVIPPGIAPSRYIELITDKRCWVEKQLARRIERFPQCALAEPGRPVAPPEILDFRAVGERVEVDYVQGRDRQRLRENGGRLLVATGEDWAGARELLMNYAKKVGARHLPGMLEREAAAFGMRYTGCKVGFPARRWGSCTCKGEIRLSAKLMFLPPHLTRHVILHELAHLDHLDHSKAYYQALARLDPHWRANTRELDTAMNYLPMIFW